MIIEKNHTKGEASWLNAILLGQNFLSRECRLTRLSTTGWTSYWSNPAQSWTSPISPQLRDWEFPVFTY